MKWFDTTRPYLRFSVATAVLLTTAVAFVFAYAANTERKIAEFNAQLVAYTEACHRKNSCYFFVADSERRGIEWLVSGAPRKEIRLLEFTSKSDPAVCLNRLLDMGVQRIRGLHYVMESTPAQRPDQQALELLPSFEIDSFVTDCKLTSAQIRLVTSLQGLQTFMLHDSYEAPWLEDKLLSQIAANPSLFEISLIGDLLTEDCFAHFDRIPHLMHVNVHSIQIDRKKVSEYQQKRLGSHNTFRKN